MKELQSPSEITKKDSIEIQQEQKKKKEYKMVGRLQPHRGHKLWKINVKTLEIEEAPQIVREDISWNDAVTMADNPGKKKEVQIEKGFAYISALNKKNAIKRFITFRGSADKRRVNI